MKVLLANRFLYRKGGSESVMYNTADLLRGAGHEVVLFGCEDSEMQAYPSPVYTCRTWHSSSCRFWEARKYFNNRDAARRMDEVLSVERPDIVHVHLLFGGLTPSILDVIHRHGIPVVHTVHDYRMVCPAYTFRNAKGEVCEKCSGGRYFNCFLGRCSKGNPALSLMMSLEMQYRNRKWHPASKLDGIIYVSRFAKDKHARIDPRFEGLNDMVLYNCSQLMSRFGDSPLDKGYYLYYGRLSSEKGIGTLLKAVKDIPGLRIKVVGKGPEEARLKEAFRDDRIEFLGYKSGDDLYTLVQEARFVCVPSEWYENNPMTIVEAYCLGVPVIGANIGGIPEIVEEGRTGFLFDSGDVSSLSRVLHASMEIDDSRYRQMRENCRAFARLHFDPETYVARLVEFYESTIAACKLKQKV